VNLYTQKVLLNAAQFIGMREKERNRGFPNPDAWNKRVGSELGSPYCAAFVWCMVDSMCTEYQVANPLPRTGSVHKMFRNSPDDTKVTVPVPGCIGFHDSGQGRGHVFLVEAVHLWTPGYLVTIEANTNTIGSREGDGVYRKTRLPDYANLGYVDLGILITTHQS
jgi:hypothetical protein